jgi:glycosyltransferase involved in cell wall biosynthesis
MHHKLISELIRTVATTQNARSRGRACIVTGEFAGPDLNGGIGTTNRALALMLRQYGFEVDILYTRVDGGVPFSARGPFVQHVNALREVGIQLSCIDHAGSWNDWQAKSYHALQHLLRQPYRLAFFDDTHGNAYYPLLARRTGNADLRRMVMCVTTHSATQWISDLNKTGVSTIEELRLMEMERRSIELADAIKAPSAYILQKYRDYGWTIPANNIVLPNFLPPKPPRKRSSGTSAINEIVFFGRLETRKGLWMFCRALDRLKYALKEKTVTFLGKAMVEDGVSTAERLLRYSASWPFTIRIISNFDHEQALAYLGVPGRVAVLPSPEDNSPSVILECLSEGVPFIACSGSGGEELLDQKSREANLFKPSVESLCTKLLELFRSGPATGQPSLDEAKVREKFADWINNLTALEKQVPAKRAPFSMQMPTLLVVVPPELAAREAMVEVARAVETFGGLVNIELLSWNAPELRFELAKAKSDLPVNVSDISDFGKVAYTLASREPSVTALCHVTQIPSPSWIERAEICFSLEKNLSAITGMATSLEKRSTRDREFFYAHDEDAPFISRYLMGNARALFPLAQETNSGFLVLRSEMLAMLAEIRPTDAASDRLKRMGDWIHELLITMHLSSKSFELVPDLVVMKQIREPHYESLCSGHFMRSLAARMYGYAPGSDQALLAHLAVDMGLAYDQASANDRYLRSVSEKFGYHLNEANLSIWNAEHKNQLAMMAHANGQIELAIDLLAATIDRSRDVSFAEFVRHEANAVVLVDAIAEKKFKTLNLDADHSFNFDEIGRQITLHANSDDKGMAALIFPSEYLGKVDHFVSSIAVDKAANPIRFRLQLLNMDQSYQWSAEKIVPGGEAMTWKIELPAQVRGECRIILGIEMAILDSSSIGAFGKWINPRFMLRG